MILVPMMQRLGRMALALAAFAMLAASPVPAIAQSAASPAQTRESVTLSASLTGAPAPIETGLIWRVFARDGAGAKQVAQSPDATPTFQLPAGDYVVLASYGLASGTRRLTVDASPVTERVTINAGGLTVKAAIGDTPIPPAKLAVSIYIPGTGNAEDKLVTSALKAGDLLYLPEGTYRVVSTYGDSNSIMRADIAIKAGKIVSATMQHRAATITLKLVHKVGGEAMADTGWTVLTPGGDVIREAIGAFPALTLAEGNYIAIARHDGKIYQGEFDVRSGVDRDVEVLAKETPAATAATPAATR